MDLRPDAPPAWFWVHEACLPAFSAPKPVGVSHGNVRQRQESRALGLGRGRARAGAPSAGLPGRPRVPPPSVGSCNVLSGFFKTEFLLAGSFVFQVCISLPGCLVVLFQGQMPSLGHSLPSHTYRSSFPLLFCHVLRCLITFCCVPNTV